VTALVLFLSALGIFSLMSVSVSRRTREIGLRAALGANPRHLLAEVLSRAMVLMGAALPPEACFSCGASRSQDPPAGLRKTLRSSPCDLGRRRRRLQAPEPGTMLQAARQGASVSAERTASA